MSQDKEEIEYIKKIYSSNEIDDEKLQKLRIEENKRSRKIDKEIAQEKELIQSQVILLLLGTGESGKSTVAKQLRVINNAEFSLNERIEFTSLVHSNIIGAMKLILRENDHNFDNKELVNLSHQFLNETISELNEDVGKKIQLFLKDPNIQKTIARGSSYHLDDSATYFLNDVERFYQSDYIPSEDDIVRCRQKTTGINETKIKMGHILLRIVDVGGQKSERKKWAFVFEGVKAIIYCIDLASYDQKLREDGVTNRMIDSINVFKDICNNKWLQKSDVILFLNKKDLFEKKIKKVPLSVCFPDCNVKNFEEGIDYITQKYLDCNKVPNKSIYSHVTCATDKQNIKAVFSAVKMIILQEALKSSGLGL